MQVLEISNPKDLKKIMQEIKVDPYGIKIMLPKATTHLLKINSISSITANILKQEMLSLGADAAVARGALTGKTQKTDCLLIGNLSQFIRLKEKLKIQPFGLNRLARELSDALANYENDKFILDLGRYKLNLTRRPQIMGILNLTPDSFSGDGWYQGLSPSQLKGTLPKGAVPAVEKMVKDGADIIDIGGESSRPGAKPVSVKEELRRTIPVIKTLAKKIKVPISIDTYKPEVAKAALDGGASIINDISGLKNTKMAKVAADYRAGVVIMHMQGRPLTMQRNPVYASLLGEIIAYLKAAIERAKENGVAENQIIIDPGIGFGKTTEHNLEILKRLSEFKVLGRPILVGPSRKAFIGEILGVGSQERIFGTVSSCVLAVRNGAKIVRVHDVLAVRQALKIFEAMDRR